ncbi:Streptomycin 3''-kinase [Pseudomonas aeruginosa MH38]|nr:Streptomycin 3''-kinase [Pseudomonas aeruginosa MH38]CEI20076.1 Streptomycin 3''-kinase [Pseudomonas aeruginosa]
MLPRLHPAAPGRLRPTVNESLDFSPYLERWALQPDGEPFATHSSRLLPVRHRGAAAMLKISSAEEERFGHVLLNWWDGQGAARVLAYDHQALLMERATGGRSLLEMVRRGDDDEATRILCQAIERIHAPRPGPLPELTPLERWFDSLYAAERRYGGLYVDCANAARYLLETAREQRPLHGDIHHGNVLDFGERGWQVIDPKRLYGERGYDYANLFTNPDAKTAQAPGRFERQLEIVIAASGLQRRRLLQWILAWTGLSAAWFDEDGSREETEAELAIARLALANLARTPAQ